MPALTFADPAVDAFRAELRVWLESHVPAAWATRFDLSEAQQSQLRMDWEKELAAGGYSGVSWPRDFGGLGLGVIEEVVFYQEAARAHAPEEANAIGKHVAGPSIMVNGTREQRQRYLPRILDGTEIWCEGYSEPGAGSDLAAVQTLAETDGGVLRITGSKIWTSNAHIADVCWLLARTSRELPLHQNLSIVLLDMHQDTIRINPIRDITGEQHFNEVVFDGAIAPIENVVGKINEGWKLASLTGFRAVSQAITGASRRYLFIREWADTINTCCGATPALSRDAARLSARVELINWQMMRAAELQAQGKSWRRATAVLHLYWSELMQEVTSFGELSRCERHRTQWRQLDLQSRAATIYGGTTQIQKNVLCKRVLGLPIPR